MRPPWLEDLHATYRPEPTASLVNTTIAAPVSDDNRADDNSDNDSANDDNDRKSAIIKTEPALRVKQNISQLNNDQQQGRYFLIPDTSRDQETRESGDNGDSDTSITTLIISVSISVISTILSIIIIVHICKRVRAKNTSSESGDSSPSCYQCHHSGLPRDFKLESDKVNSGAGGGEVDNVVYAPVNIGTDYSHYQQLHSLTPVSNIYNMTTNNTVNNTQENDIYR